MHRYSMLRYPAWEEYRSAGWWYVVKAPDDKILQIYVALLMSRMQTRDLIVDSWSCMSSAGPGGQTLSPIKPRLDCQEWTRLSRVEGFAARRVSHLKMRAGGSYERKVSHVQNSQTIVAAEKEAQTKKGCKNTLFIPKWRWKGT
jgi:hypothetical protein